MSERLTQCPKCRSVDVETVQIHNPDTIDMNAKATLKCLACQHEWEGLVMSPRQERDRRQGWSL